MGSTSQLVAKKAIVEKIKEKCYNLIKRSKTDSNITLTFNSLSCDIRDLGLSSLTDAYG